MLMHQLTLALHHTSIVPRYKSLIHHPLEVLKVPSFQSISYPIIQASQETLLFLLINVDMKWGVARQLCELGDILIHRHRPLF
jgi:hypothetical protein